jgi:hypothetical protein
MKVSVIALAAFAAIGFSGAAFAGQATSGATAQAAGPAVMSDSQMDAVTAGAAEPNPGLGLGTAADNPGFGPKTTTGHGRGVCTTGASGRC